MEIRIKKLDNGDIVVYILEDITGDVSADQCLLAIFGKNSQPVDLKANNITQRYYLPL